MRIYLQSFGPFTEILPGTTELELSERAQGSELLRQLEERFPEQQKLIHASRLVRDRDFIPTESALRPGETLQLIPPVGGG
jgi:molybdopterin converting factor small subunit